jgi:hypothetical protein
VSKTFPALSREDIETLLSTIPIYAITDTNKDGGLVLLDEPNNSNSLAYFFCSPETAIAAFKPYKEKLSMEEQQPAQVAWDVTSFSLGLIWSELFKPPSIVNGIEYRLIPHPQETSHARSLLEQSALESGLTRAPQVFGADSYNEIPVFLDPSLRLADANGKERVPMYFGYDDMMDAYQQVRGNDAPLTLSASSSTTSIINVVELFSLLGQMEQESTSADFSKVLLVPCSPPPPPQRNEKSRGLLDDILPSPRTLEKRQEVIPITPSMESDGWSD